MSRDDQETSDRFAKSLDLPYPLVGDRDGSIARAWGVKWPLIGLARRATFLVARDGRIRLAFHSERKVDEHVTRSCEAVAGLA